MTRTEEGFSLVEVIIAMFLLGLVAVAILPALWQGLVLSVQQSATATASRQIHALLEETRENPTCAQIATATASRTVTTGSGQSIVISGTSGACPSTNKTVSVRLTAVDGSGDRLADLTAIVYVP